MTKECRNYCRKKIRLAKPENRPGLPRIRYRIGSYIDFRDFMLEALNNNEILSSWTHREPDDPGIALIEGASVVLDILTFYEELYANEAFLCAASWRESIAALVRLTGYRLAPGIGGKATFAFEVKSGSDVTVPRGFPIKAQLEGIAGQTNFETDSVLTAVPALGKFRLYRELTLGSFPNSVNVFSVLTADLKPGQKIEKNDRLLLFDNPPDIYPQIVTVARVEQEFDRTNIYIEGSVNSLYGKKSIKGYKIGRTFRYFGHNAPPTKVTIDSSHQASQSQVSFYLSDIFPSDGDQFPRVLCLEGTISDLNPGTTLILTGGGIPTPLQVETVIPYTMTLGAMTGATTLVLLNDPPPWSRSVIIQTIIIYETIGSPLKLDNAYEYGADTDHLFFFGDGDTYKKLAGRRLFLHRQDNSYAEIAAQTCPVSPGYDEEGVFFRPVAFTWPEGWSVNDFPGDNPAVEIFGNIVDATQGKKEKEAVLGNGDAREVFQTFKLPKAPLTYTDQGIGDWEPRLEIYVDNRLWTRVPTLFGCEPEDEVYIVREDDIGSSFVRFGDGKTGRRLPTGMENVTARYRTGIGAYGPGKEGSDPLAGEKLNRLEKIRLAGIASGGCDPESGENARRSAPGRVQSLGRLVSLRDFECEALSIPAVELASAIYDIAGYTPAIVMTVLLKNGREKELDSVTATMTMYNRCRGPGRYPVVVNQGVRKPVHLEVLVSFDPKAKKEVVIKAIKVALGIQGEEGEGIDSTRGLFSTCMRRFGEPEYATRVKGIIQNAGGVWWVKVTSFSLVQPGDLSPYPRDDVVNCDPDSVLNLMTDDFTLADGSGGPEGDCT